MNILKLATLVAIAIIVLLFGKYIQAGMLIDGKYCLSFSMVASKRETRVSNEVVMQDLNFNRL